MQWENTTQPSIMESLDPIICKEEAMKPDVSIGFNSIPFIETSDSYHPHDNTLGQSIPLMDANENLSMDSVELFKKAFRCSDNEKIKVVSIFGNIGDGKSHTMNHLFFGGDNIFKTSNEQTSCTIGVYAALQRKKGVLCLDTEGLLSATAKNDHRLRMLFKILAISDIVIYRTRAECLHEDMFNFFDIASKAFTAHFSKVLESLALPGTAHSQGPAVIVFQETKDIFPYKDCVDSSAEEKLRKRFNDFPCDISAFSSLRFVGIKTDNGQKTNFRKLDQILQHEIDIRLPRSPTLVFQALKALNQKFCGNIEKQTHQFPEEYFTCPVTCQSCNKRCQRSMGHQTDTENHYSQHACEYQQQYENKVYLCKKCHNNGKEVIVEKRALTQNDTSMFSWAKFVWKGFVIECPHCGEIYRSRQHWYGNEAPEVAAILSQIVHIWNVGNVTKKGTVHSAQMVLDGVTYVTDTITGISAQPTKALTDWFADRVAPSYWVPNQSITHCKGCQKNFNQTDLPKHHCRGCGEGFCNACSLHRLPVPARGWYEPVRVCNSCRKQLLGKGDIVPGRMEQTEDSDIFARKYGESFCNAISTVKAVAWEYPKEMIKNTARPDYWVEDKDAPNCYICHIIFGTAEELELIKDNGNSHSGYKNTATQNHSNVGAVNTSHTIRTNGGIKGDCRRHHCRRCGQAVCEACSRTRRPVPERGWPTSVRVCDGCLSEDGISTADKKLKAA